MENKKGGKAGARGKEKVKWERKKIHRWTWEQKQRQIKRDEKDDVGEGRQSVEIKRRVQGK